MILEDIGMLACSSNRTKYYLRYLKENGIIPSKIIFMHDAAVETPEEKSIKESGDRGQARSDSSNVPEILKGSVLAFLAANDIPCTSVPTLDPNDDRVVREVSASRQTVFIYSGPGGAILRSDILSTGKRFLHVHPGYRPCYRGSTTVYYSLLEENDCGATAFFLDKRIDSGPIIERAIYSPPEDRTGIDLHYDPFIRADLLIKVLKDYLENGVFAEAPQDSADGETYYIIHPVLKHIAILSKKSSTNNQGR